MSDLSVPSVSTISEMYHPQTGTKIVRKMWTDKYAKPSIDKEIQYGEKSVMQKRYGIKSISPSNFFYSIETINGDRYHISRNVCDDNSKITRNTKLKNYHYRGDISKYCDIYRQFKEILNDGQFHTLQENFKRLLNMLDKTQKTSIVKKLIHK